MLKQGVKRISIKFIRTRALSQLFLVQFRPYATSFPGLFFFLTSILKSQKTLETDLDLTHSLKNSVDARVKGLVLNVDYL